jgi:opine dehydrogenase
VRIAILGAGNGGQSSAAHLALGGHPVSLYDRYPEALEAFRDSRRLTASGEVQGEALLSLVTSDLCAAVDGAELILVSVPAFAVDYIAVALGACVEPNQVVILHPGGTGGALRVRALWDEHAQAQTVVLAETETLVYACRLLGPGRPDIKAVKRCISLAVLPGPGTGRAFELMSSLYPQVVSAASVLETGLANMNPVMHPPIVLGNLRAIESPGPRFNFYGDGVSQSVAAMIDALDAERVAVADAYGVNRLPLHDWVARAYGVREEDTAQMCKAMSRSVYRGIEAPDRVDSRYLSEDVPDGLVPWSELGALAGVATTFMDAVILLASTINGIDYRIQGRTLARLGLAGLSPPEITAKLQAS